MVKRRVRAKDAVQALMRARKKYPSMTVRVRWLHKVKKNKKGERQYTVFAHKRMMKK